MGHIGTDIQQAITLLESGKLVAIPTETVYGLAANALNVDAIAEVFKAKNRPSFDPLIIHLANADGLDKYVKSMDPSFIRIYERFSPGPISFVLHKKDLIPDLVTAGHSTVAIRFPMHLTAQALLRNLDFPLAAPSANLFGRVSPTSAAHVEEQLGDKIDYILDGGQCTIGLESTIIDLSTKKPKVLRLGGLSLEELEDCLGEEITFTKNSSSNPKAPGMLSAHYSPGIPVIFGNLAKNLKQVNRHRCGIISFRDMLPGVPEENQRVLSPKGDLKEAAAALFRSLRSFNTDDIDQILAEEFPKEGLGRAINDRLKRASAS
jgi:L-threonylcarbamoyladenylate synthase